MVTKSKPPISAVEAEADAAQPSAHVQAQDPRRSAPQHAALRRADRFVKFGGHAMGDEALAAAFAQDIVYLKQSGVNPIVVHGGGPQIANMLKKLEIKSDFVQGLRVTDKPTVEVVEMVLAGLINKEIVSAINQQGGKAVGICGKDANLMIATQDHRDAGPRVEPDEGGRHRLCRRSRRGQPAHRRRHRKVGPHSGHRAGRLYRARAKRSTSTPIRSRPRLRPHEGEAPAVANRRRGRARQDGELLQELTVDEARALIRDGTISGGMIPKIEGCIEVVEAGVEAVVIINGKVKHSVLLELFTDHGAGTLVGRKKGKKA